MRSSCRPVLFTFMFLGSVLTSSCSGERAKTDEGSKVTLEFRRAETEAREGLTKVSVPGHTESLYLHATADITTADIAEARVIAESQEPYPVVELVFTADGSKKMAVLTEEHLNKRFAILLNGRAVSAPLVLAPITERVQIMGDFNKAEANRLVKSINTK